MVPDCKILLKQFQPHSMKIDGVEVIFKIFPKKAIFVSPPKTTIKWIIMNGFQILRYL